MKRTKELMELYKALWLSADFETDLESEFPYEFDALKRNEENKIPNNKITSMYIFMCKHSAFN